jgi:MFS family permease
MAKRATIASTIGTALEWIDFTVYGAVAATVFPKLFFAPMDPDVGILVVFATFGVGFFARPLGGLFFGTLGDRLGRKNILLYTLSLMGLSSFLIGCLPTYDEIGFAAPLALVALRFLQGFALGGEATGAQLMSMEHAPAARRGLYGSFVNIGSSLSAAVANGMLFTLTSILGEREFQAWGWRLPFLMSLVLVLVGVYVRLKVSETPAFEASRATGTAARLPALEAFRRHPLTILRLLAVWCAPAACFHVVNVFSLSYLTRNLGLASQSAFLCLMAVNVLALFVVVGSGALSDRIGRKPTMILASIVMLLIATSYFTLLDTRNWVLIFLAMGLFVWSIQAQSGVQPAFFAEPFPTSVRYSGSAAAYTGANLLFAGPAPFVAAWLLQHSGGMTWVITAYCMVLIGCSLIALIAGPETRHLDINR